MKNLVNVLLTFGLLLVCSFSLFSQEQISLTGTPNKSPAHVVYNHLFYLQPEQYDPELSSRSFSPEMTETDIENAQKLKQIFDGLGHYIDVNLIPDEANHLDSLSGYAIYRILPNELPDIYLQKRDSSWYYSRTTVQAIADIHKEVFPLGSRWIMSLIPMQSSDDVLGLKYWQLLGFLFVLALIIVVFYMLRTTLRILLKGIFRSFPEYVEESKDIILKSAKYISLLLSLWVARVLLRSLLLPITYSEGVNRILNIFSSVFYAFLAFQILSWLLLYVRKYFDRTDNMMDNQLLPILDRTGKIIIGSVAIMSILNEVDVNITALLAGISIGGLALALAAQDSVKNLIGSVMIFIDRPFQIGDYIEGNEISGTVEEVGFRTSRLRKIDSTMQIIPNGKLADLIVNNYGQRIHRMNQLNLTLTYGTSKSQLQDFISGLKQIIMDHRLTNKENFYVNLKGLGESSIDVFFRCYIQTENYKEELTVKEEILFAIMDLAKQLNVEFAYPTITIDKS